MRQFNLSQIMKSAWRKFKCEKGMMSFSDCLKNAWAFAKLQLNMAGIEKACKESIRKQNAEARTNRAQSTPGVSYNDLNIPQSAFYSNRRGRLNSHFVND